MSEHRGIWRGKRFDNNEWVEGYLIRDKHGSFICNIKSYYPVSFKPNIVTVQVDPSTLGECTCVCDKNDTLIFEGDIVEYDNRICEIKYIEWLAMFDMNPVGGKRGQEPTLSKIVSPDMLVIGNIHDNPELLAKGAAGKHFKKGDKP